MSSATLPKPLEARELILVSAHEPVAEAAAFGDECAEE